MTTTVRSGRRPAHAPGEGGAPAWFDGLAVAAGLGAAAFAAPGLALAVAGWWSAPLALGLGAVAAVAAVPAVRAVAHPRVTARGGHLAAAAAVGIAVAAFVANGWAPAQHVFVDRDPGAYATAGRWLARDGTLEPVVAVGPFADARGLDLRVDSIAVPDAGDGRVQIQFSHALPVLLADAHAVGGHRALFRVPALLGAAALLAVHAAAARVLRRPALALAVTATVAVALPQVAVSRDTFSEPLAQLWLWSGVVALLAAHRRRSPAAGLAAGLLLGAVATARIDGFSYLLALPVLAVLAVRGAPPAERRALVRTGVAVAAGAAVMAALAALDLGLRGGDYASDNAGALRLAALGLVVSIVAAAGIGRGWERHASALGGESGGGVRHRAATVAAGVVGAGLAAAWLVRPLVQTATASVPSGLIAQLQEAEGVAVDPLRSYAEDSLQWFAWYLGPLTLAAAVAGAAAAAHRILRRPEPALLTSVAVAAPSTALYLWSHGAAPDHIWVMRRFVPAAIVLVVLLAAHALDRAPRAVAAALAAAGVVWAGAVTWPVRDHREQGGYLGVVDGTCATVGADAAVLFVDDGTPLGGVIAGGLPMSIRAWCGVPVAVATSPTGEAVDDLAAAWAAEGRTLWLAAAGPATFGPLAEGREIVPSPLVVNDRALARTVTHRPDTHRTEQLGFSLLPWTRSSAP